MLGVTVIAVEQHLPVTFLGRKGQGDTRCPLGMPPVCVKPLVESRHYPARDESCSVKAPAISVDTCRVHLR